MERLQKVLAQAGIASRRAAEQIILAGRVRVDGRVVRELGTQVDPRKSRVEVDGNKIVAEKLVYIVLHKPRGVVCTLNDPEGRPTILELIKEAGGRLVPVGRLDFHTSGALLCTNDGEFAQALAHPKLEVPKVYVAKVKGTVEDDALERFEESVVIDGRPTQPAQVKRLRFEGDKTWLEITLREGRNRQVRRLGEATGFPVMRLARLSHAGVSSEDLRPGQWRELTEDELVDLKKRYGVPKKVRAPSLDYTKGQAPRGEGPAAKYDKRAPRKAVQGPVRAPARDDSRSSTREQPSPGRLPRGSDREQPVRGERAQTFGRKVPPLRGERAQSARHEDPNRPWKTRSRSAIESRPENNRRGRAPVARQDNKVAGRTKRSAEENRNPTRPGTNPARPGADRGPGKGGREARPAKLGGKQENSARQDDPTRPWKTRSRSANEERPQNNRRGRAPVAGQDAKVARQPKRSQYIK